MSGRAVGLLGSGEFEPWSEAVDRRLLAASGRPEGPVLVLPTAAAPEGDGVFDRWGAMGLAHFERLGVPAEVLPLKTREDAERAELADRLRGAALVYFSGGNPAYLAATLAGTRFWSALAAGLDDGLAYAGCSAGMAALGELTLDSSVRDLDGQLPWRAGLRLFPNTVFGPHWDTLEEFIPGLRGAIEGALSPGRRLLALDERTAVAGDGERWTVFGAGCAHLHEGGVRRRFAAGETFEAPAVRGIRPSTRRPRPAQAGA